MNPLVTHVVGARPNFMKAAPVIEAISAAAFCEQQLVHTGQHYDRSMSEVFFEELGLPEPNVNLGVGSGDHTRQTAEIMVRFDAILHQTPPDLVVVYGDVNSTLAVALASARKGLPIAHVEAGLRSFDRDMPEEINRLLTDQLAELLLTHSEDADVNLVREGIESARIHRVGNVMIDTLRRLERRARRLHPEAALGLAEREFVLATLHRPSNVDESGQLKSVLDCLERLSQRLPVIFPLHPRTRLRIEELGLDSGAIRFLDPLGYLEFLALQRRARAVITDSGGIQEETTVLGVPCFTLRDTTERPVTVSLGTNRLVGSDPDALEAAVGAFLDGEEVNGRIPPLWDGRAAARVAAVIEEWFGSAGT